MKRIYILLSILIISLGSVFAQTPKERTATTIVADVLAQSPYSKASDYDKAMKELLTTGEDGVLQLVSMMRPLQYGENANIEYALSGLTNYAAKDGEDSRLKVSYAYIKALDTVQERDIQDFIVRQLGIIGQDEAVEKLGTLLRSEYSSSSMALANIKTTKAVETLMDELRSTEIIPIKTNIVNALGFLGSSRSETAIKGLLTTNDAKLKQAAVQALGKVGTASSLKDLEKLAKQANFSLDHNSATGAYLELIKRLITRGEIKDAEKAAKSLESNAKKANANNVRCAALQLLMQCKPEEANKLALKALKDPNTQYQLTALKAAMERGDKNSLIAEVIKEYPKAKDDVKINIASWLEEETCCPDNVNLIQSLAVEPLIESLITTQNTDLQKAISQTLVKTKDTKGILPLVSLLSSDNDTTIQIAQEALARYEGDIATPIAEQVLKANDNSAKAMLDLLSLRRASKYLSNAITLTNTGSESVKADAYNALQYLTEAKQINTMYSMLESAPEQYVTPMQDAVIASLNDMPKEDRYKEISEKVASTPQDKQYLYYKALATTADQRALDIIVKGFSSNDKKTRDAAFEALTTWSNTDVADILLGICKDQAASSYFDRAIDAYIKLASDKKLTGENRVIYLREAMQIAKTDTQKKSILNHIKNTGTFQGLLFAGQFLDNKAVQQEAAQAIMNIALNNKSFTGAEVEALLNKVIDILDNPDAGYQKEAIRKHLRETPMQNGFVSMFNGKDLYGWKGLVGNPISRAKMNDAALAKAQAKADETMKRDWFVEDGCIVFDGKGYDNLCSVKQYGDFEMYVDWKLDTSGTEADAGIYLRGTPQVQMWDISRTNVGAQVGSGGLYNNQTNESKPLKVADNKLGMWNTFYIRMVGDRVTVYLNGELVTDNVILENYWDRKQAIFPIEQVELQAHGSKVYYRDIYIKELERAKPFELSAEEKAEGFEILFDGSNMHNWTGNTTDYILEDGCISLHPSKRFGGNLYTKEQYGNFIYRFEFQLTPGANNGVGIRTPMEGDAAYVGMEVQILDHDHPIYANITPLQVHGSVYGVIPAKRAKLKPAGEWNYEEIIADGDNIKVTLNGEVILEGNLKEAMKNGAADGKDHPGVSNKSGHIGFLGHGNPLKFKNIRIKRLK